MKSDYTAGELMELERLAEHWQHRHGFQRLAAGRSICAYEYWGNFSPRTYDRAHCRHNRSLHG
jgi:hypothetical protein